VNPESDNTMKRLSIGVDIDGVIVDYATAMLPIVSEVCDRPVCVQELWCWDLTDALDISQEQMRRIWEETLGTDLLRAAPPIDGAIHGLSRLSMHEIWLITARPLSMQDLTLSWLAENNVQYDHVIHGRYGDKVEAGRGFDVFVEDRLDEACTIAEAGVFSILLDQPWNQTPQLPPNCQRVYDWKSILSLIGTLEQN